MLVLNNRDMRKALERLKHTAMEAKKKRVFMARAALQYRMALLKTREQMMQSIKQSETEYYESQKQEQRRLEMAQRMDAAIMRARDILAALKAYVIVLVVVLFLMHLCVKTLFISF